MANYWKWLVSDNNVSSEPYKTTLMNRLRVTTTQKQKCRQQTLTVGVSKPVSTVLTHRIWSCPCKIDTCHSPAADTPTSEKFTWQPVLQWLVISHKWQNNYSLEMNYISHTITLKLDTHHFINNRNIQQNQGEQVSEQILDSSRTLGMTVQQLQQSNCNVTWQQSPLSTFPSQKNAPLTFGATAHFLTLMLK